jgi:hypothetical protein
VAKVSTKRKRRLQRRLNTPTNLRCKLRQKWPQCKLQPFATKLQKELHVSYLCTFFYHTPSSSAVVFELTYYFGSFPFLSFTTRSIIFGVQAKIAQSAGLGRSMGPKVFLCLYGKSASESVFRLAFVCVWELG